jgi:hypothetical protein
VCNRTVAASVEPAAPKRQPDHTPPGDAHPTGLGPVCRQPSLRYDCEQNWDEYQDALRLVRLK